MTDNKFDLITIGESLIEFSTNQKLEDAECLHKYYGGDSLVVAVAAKRLNAKVGFITCLGDDSFKDYLLSSWNKEGLDISHVKVVNDQNGIYMVSRASVDDKEFVYYRKKIAPAKLSIDDIDEEYIKNSKIVYASGITQSLSLNSREAVKRAFEIAKENGILTAYDPNYSSIISSPEDAKEYFDEIIPLTDILFMSSKYDTKSIFEIESLENIVKHLTDCGIQTIVIKSSKDKGYFVNNQCNTSFIPFYTENIIDTTSSGDAFNGAFLYSIANGYNPVEAAKIASIDAGLQAQGIGAIKSTPYHDEVFKIFKTEEF
ncbi:sugar kinase [bacterium]|nr:sugar kinase [bacterium]